MRALDALLAETRALHAAALPGRYQPATDAAIEEQARDLLPASDAEGALFAAEEAGALVGAIRLNVVDVAPTPLLAARRYAFVYELVVARSHQRRGIGRGLMERAERWAEERGIVEIELNVFAFNRGAVAFYEALGYTAVQHRMRRLR